MTQSDVQDIQMFPNAEYQSPGTASPPSPLDEVTHTRALAGNDRDT